MAKSPKRRPQSTPPRSKAQPVSAATAPKAVSLDIKVAEKPIEKVSITKTAEIGHVELIRFDSRVKWFLWICVAVLLVLTVLKIHFTSVAIWNRMLPDGSDIRRGLVSGEPRQIRADDYLVGVTWMMSQKNHGNPEINPAIGVGKSPVMTAPSIHFTSIFKPTNWGFLLFDIETGYSFGVMINIIGNLIILTFLFLLLTGNNFWLSLFGSSWIILSTGNISWTAYPLYPLMMAPLLVISAIYVLYSSSIRQLVTATFLLTWSAVSFVLVLYPPYQIPIVYLFICLFAGFLIKNWQPSLLSNKLSLKLIGFGISGIATMLVLYIWSQDVKETLEIVSNTAYPGKRSLSGGDGFIANWFSEFFIRQTNDLSYPTNWSNYCELAHYLTFVPVILPGIAISFFQKHKVDWSLILLLAFTLVMLSWIELGWPSGLAKLTLMSMSQPARTQIVLGFGSVFLTVLYLDYLKKNPLRISVGITALGMGLSLAYLLYAAQINIADSAGFFTWSKITLPIIFFTVLSALLWPTWLPRYRTLIFGLGITFFLLPNLRINPISVGLSPILDNAAYKSFRELQQRDPKARWIVFGDALLSYMATAAGVDIVSGVKYAPNLKEFRILDSTMKQDTVYNRYAHLIYSTYIDPAHADTTIFRLPVWDHVQILMDPCSPKLKQLGVKYVVFDHQPQPVEVRTMKPVTSLGAISIYAIQ